MREDVFFPTGYMGGKRRLRRLLRPLLLPLAVRHYIEPCAGGADTYLDLRARGYAGPAVLADANPDVAAFWRLAHGESAADLVAAAEGMGRYGFTREHFDEVRFTAVAPGPERTARFLWLLNYGFSNRPPVYDEARGVWAGGISTKVPTTPRPEHGNKTFPWGPCVDRLRQVVRLLKGAPCAVMDDCRPALALATEESTTYIDPPYDKTYGYVRGEPLLFVEMARQAPGQVLLSEKADLRAMLPGWTALASSVTERVSQGRGATGHRGEWLYMKCAPAEPLAAGEVHTARG